MVINLPKKLILLIAFVSIANLDVLRHKSSAFSLESANQIYSNKNLFSNTLLASSDHKNNGIE